MASVFGGAAAGGGVAGVVVSSFFSQPCADPRTIAAMKNVSRTLVIENLDPLSIRLASAWLSRRQRRGADLFSTHVAYAKWPWASPT